MTEQKTSSEIIKLVKKECKKGNINNAIIYLNEAIEIYPHDARFNIVRGRLNLDQGNHEDAIEDYTKAIETDPNNALSYELRADAKSKLRDYQGAINDYSKAIELDLEKNYSHFSKVGSEVFSLKKIIKVLLIARQGNRFRY